MTSTWDQWNQKAWNSYTVALAHNRKLLDGYADESQIKKTMETLNNLIDELQEGRDKVEEEEWMEKELLLDELILLEELNAKTEKLDIYCKLTNEKGEVYTEDNFLDIDDWYEWLNEQDLANWQEDQEE